MIFLLQTSSRGLDWKPMAAMVEIMYWVLGGVNWSAMDSAFTWSTQRVIKATTYRQRGQDMKQTCWMMVSKHWDV